MQISKTLKSTVGIVLAGVMALSLTACAGKTAETGAASAAPASSAAASASPSSTKYADTITVVWYPNESATDYDAARKHYEDLIAQATGKKVVEKLTTDYNIAIEALANGQAQIGAVMGALGYIQAQKENPAVKALFVNTGASGTLDDAVYYSWLCVNKGQEQNYMTDGKYSIDNIQGKKMSFVSNSSTSGFLFPTTSIIGTFSKTDKWKSLTSDDLTQGGSDKFFSEVLFGGSHQGSAVNLLSGKADVAAFCDTELANYVSYVSGDNKTAGSVLEIKSGSTAPFDKLAGKQFVILQSMPVLNAPTAYNSETLSPEDAKAIQTLMTSSTVASDPQVFIPKGSTVKGMFAKTDKEQFVVADDSWYDSIRKMAG